MICEICNQEIKSYNALSKHIEQIHQIQSIDYYKTYIKPGYNNICPNCNKPTKFHGFKYGFSTYCSSKCASSASMKKLHKENDGIKWCDICKSNTKHILGIGCMSCYNKSDKHKNSIISTIQERYGSQYTNVYQVPSIKAKIVKTAMTKYNTSNPGNGRDARIKANNTMRANGNYSTAEDYFANQLNKFGIKFETQYKSNKYPFYCDFYLNDFDTYIELNIYWSHNNHFFNKDDPKDIDTLKLWTEKAITGHRQYQNAINVWTKRDLLKYETAKQNNLNYIILWSNADIDNFLNILVHDKDLSKLYVC